MVVGPLRAIGKLGGSASAVEMIVDVETDRFGFPLDRVDMKVVGEMLITQQAVGRADAFVTGISRAMNCAVYRCWLLADVLHDVDLAALRPADFADVIAEHPECRPDPLSLGDLDAGFEAPILLGEFAQGFLARGSVVSRHSVGAGVFLLQHFDLQIDAQMEGALAASGVVLHLLVAPTIASGFGNALS